MCIRDSVGGIAGQKTAGAAQVIQGCYNAGTVTSSSGNSRGAMVGNAADTAGINFCYYDKTLWDTSGGGSGGGGGDGIHGTGLSTELLKNWAAAYALKMCIRDRREDISGGVNTETGREPATGPGIETDGNQVPETDGKEETAMPSEEENGTTAVDQETETPASSGTSGENGSEPEKETAQPTDVTEEEQTDREEEADTEPEELESEGVKEEAPEPSQEDKASVDKTSADSGLVQDEPASMETVGYRSLNRQRLALKVSSVMEVDVDEYLEASPPNAEETPSVATPSNAADSNEESKNDGESQLEETELQYIGNPNGDTYIPVSYTHLYRFGVSGEDDAADGAEVLIKQAGGKTDG